MTVSKTTVGSALVALALALGAAGCEDVIHHGDAPRGDADAVTGGGDTTPLPVGVHVVGLEVADGRALPGSSYSHGTGNGDGAANPGETVHLRVALHNRQSLAPKGVEGTLRLPEPHPCVENISDNRHAFGTLEAQAETDPSRDGSHFAVVLAPGCAPPQSVPFTLRLEDDEGRTWEPTVTLDVTSTGARLAFREVEVADGRLLPGSSYPRGSGNGDGAVSRGEKPALRVHVFNEGTADTHGLSATLSSDDECVVVTDDDSNLGDVPAGNGESGDRDSDFAVDIARTCAGPRTVTFQLALEDRYGNRWNDTFDLDIEAIDVALSVRSVEVADGRALPGYSYSQGSGDGDGQAEAGERVALRVSLRNTGGSGTRSLDGRVTASDECLQVTDDEANLGDVDGGGSTLADGSAHFTVQVGDGCAGSRTLTLSLEDLYGNPYETPLSFTVN